MEATLEMEMVSPVFVLSGDWATGATAQEIVRCNPGVLEASDKSTFDSIGTYPKYVPLPDGRARHVQLGRFSRNATWDEIREFMKLRGACKTNPMHPAHFLDVLRIVVECPQHIEAQGIILSTHTWVTLNNGTRAYPGVDNGDMDPDEYGHRRRFEVWASPIYVAHVPNTIYYAMYVNQ